MRVRVIATLIASALLAAVCSGPVTAGSYLQDKENKSGTGGVLPLPTVGAPYCDAEGYPKYHWKVIADVLATDVGVVVDEIGTADGSPFFLRKLVQHWCTNEADEGFEKFEVFYISIITTDTVAYYFDLYPKVKEFIPDPLVEWKDLDADHGWLWVNVEHSLGIQPVIPVEQRAKAGNWMAGYAEAFVKATPAELTIEFLDAPDLEFEPCDLARATEPDGCQIVFHHSSSIAPDSVFHGTIELRWDVSSNSGKYNGAVIITRSEFEIQVAEAMAVTRE